RRSAGTRVGATLYELPWIPSDEEWRQILEAARQESLRNRFMLALAYDAALRREELCLLRTDDLDPAFRSLRVRAETTKNRRERVIPYSAATGELLRSYLEERRVISRARGPLFPLHFATEPRCRDYPVDLVQGGPWRRHTRR